MRLLGRILMTMRGKLYLVATPIGNLGDISIRALDILRSVDLIACEDTRHTQKLLNHFEIRTKTISYHEHNEAERAEQLLSKLSSGSSVAVVSDAGTPGINDPGYFVVQKAISIGADIVPIPGPVAYINAVIASGLPTDSIYFGGFLPPKKNDRKRRLEELRSTPATLAFYETPHRILVALSDCIEILGDRRAATARELTKLHEEFVRGSISEIISSFSDVKPRGEFVLVIDRERESDMQSKDELASLPERVAELESEGMGRKDAMKKAAKEFGLSRSEAYRMIHSRSTDRSLP
jgi:16S rRNA (cytidine1402-2'-O)-methyltransferase